MGWGWGGGGVGTQLIIGGVQRVTKISIHEDINVVQDLVLLPGAEFQAVGNMIMGSFFTNSTRWGGTYKSSALRSNLSGLRSLLDNHIWLKEGGSFLK